MRLGLLVCLVLEAQTGPEVFKSHCAGCHGPTGEGSRGPSLRVPLLKRAHDIDSLVSLIRRGIPGSEMQAIPAQVIGDAQLRAVAAYVLALGTDVKENAGVGIARGAELFRTKGKCLDCHRVNGQGKALAPDLSDVGRHRDLNWLRRAVVEPQAEIFDTFSSYRWVILTPDNYLLVELTTKAGDKITGHRLNEDAFSIQIRDSEGRVRSFLKNEIRDLRKRWGESPMPSYKGVFSASELDDLVAYLASLRGAR